MKVLTFLFAAIVAVSVLTKNATRHVTAVQKDSSTFKYNSAFFKAAEHIDCEKRNYRCDVKYLQLNDPFCLNGTLSECLIQIKYDEKETIRENYRIEYFYGETQQYFYKYENEIVVFVRVQHIDVKVGEFDVIDTTPYKGQTVFFYRFVAVDKNAYQLSIHLYSDQVLSGAVTLSGLYVFIPPSNEYYPKKPIIDVIQVPRNFEQKFIPKFVGNNNIKYGDFLAPDITIIAPTNLPELTTVYVPQKVDVPRLPRRRAVTLYIVTSPKISLPIIVKKFENGFEQVKHGNKVVILLK
uniref:DUF1573 domain-containing protein n=1 Tax=Rhabditophanes sp. KR3021 TaxID=114890 RepID=A0AC35U1P0_9BILA